MPDPDQSLRPSAGGGRLVVVFGGWAVAAVGLVALAVTTALDPGTARSAAAQVWSPFVLVTGLILVGQVADRDGLFAAAGHRLASWAPNGTVQFAGAAVMIAIVTAVLNLDTSVVFLTPVLVYAARSRGSGETPLVIACILLSNAGSLLLPGSNLTNLIVLGQLHLSGGQFFGRMFLPWIASVVVTAAVIGAVEHRSLRTTIVPTPTPEPAVIGLGLLAVLTVVLMVLILRTPALPVAAVGLVAVGLRLAAGREQLERVRGVLGVPVLVALFGIAVALGALGRSWSGPATVLAHLNEVGTVVFAGATSVLVNNLPAASLLSARPPPHPFALLVGLDIGPNLFVTGSLAWFLWWRTTRATGARVPVARAVLIGLVTAPLAMAAALGMLGVTGTH